ncbi:hypothetical protein [Roseomonas sp. BN140053]|uniref:hypothetical protein n=1 Tax=Roseomonas sp. BN140053 TaxID=3391898 RepID=UPI0039EA3774
MNLPGLLMLLARRLPEPAKRGLRGGFRGGVAILRGVPAGQQLSRGLGRLAPGLKAGLVRRFLAYERSRTGGEDAFPAPAGPRSLPLPPPELGGAERAVFLRLAARGGG